MTLANDGQRSRNTRFREMLAQGVPLATVCRKLNLSRKYGIQLAAEIGIVLPKHLPAAVENNPRRGAGHEPLPSGHPLSWGILPRLASLEGGV